MFLHPSNLCVPGFHHMKQLPFWEAPSSCHGAPVVSALVMAPILPYSRPSLLFFLLHPLVGTHCQFSPTTPLHPRQMWGDRRKSGSCKSLKEVLRKMVEMLLVVGCMVPLPLSRYSNGCNHLAFLSLSVLANSSSVLPWHTSQEGR